MRALLLSKMEKVLGRSAPCCIGVYPPSKKKIDPPGTPESKERL